MELHAGLDAFLQDVTARALSRKTWKRYHDDLHDLLNHLERRSLLQLEDVRPADLRDYLAELQTRSNGHRPQDHLSPFTIEGRYRSLKTFFNWLALERLITANPMERLRRPRLPRRLVPRLTEDQVRALLEAVEETVSPERNMALLLLMVDSGLRRGETLGLQLDDLDLVGGKVRVFGKGRKERLVPLGQASTRALREWLSLRPPAAGGHVFVKADGAPLAADAVRSLFLRLQARAGLRKLYPHLLRHTFAVLYLKRAADVKSLQQILGHSKASTTLDLYVEFPFEELKRLHSLASPVDALERTPPGDGSIP